MPGFTEMSREQLQGLQSELQARYQQLRNQGLSLDMTRGKPCPEQLDLANPMLEVLERDDFRTESGLDCRNYGVLAGLPEARELFAEYLGGVTAEQTIVFGNSSLTLMHDTVWRAWTFGVPGGSTPWSQLEHCRFLCPSPGYDRHFKLCEHLGIEMIPVAMGADGPDLDRIEELVEEDASIKGIWCVPRYSNPTGVTYSPEVVERLARMPTAAPDFRIFWDNAYQEHHLVDDPEPLAAIMPLAVEAGHADRVLMFGSTSKISFAGGGLAVFAASLFNVEWALEHMSKQSIGPDKLNQLRHLRFFGDLEGIRTHMRKHAAIIRPKFDILLEVLERDLAGTGVACWNRPQGGYFVSLDTMEGCARRVHALAAEAGIRLTPAGATYPYGDDWRDSNLRLAPTLPSVEEIGRAMEGVALCVKLAALEKLLS